MDEKYIEIVKVINELINDFNNHLESKFKIPLFNPDRKDDFEIYTELRRYPWDDFRFPNDTKNGVYFLAGYDPMLRGKRVLYIGKASFSDTIGMRLYSHLFSKRNEENYTMCDKNGIKHNLEYVFSIDLDSVGLTFLASALEEYLITHSKGKLYLLNGIGN
jgi:hypothetical protein